MTRLLISKREKLLVLCGAAFAYALDALSKNIILAVLQPGESIPLIPGVFQITRMHNTGAAFSMFYQHPEALTLVSAAMLGIFTWYMFSKKYLSTFEMVGFSLILGGATGNLADRVHLGAVTDFLDFILIRYPVFNLADSCILIGVVFLLVEYVKYRHETTCS